MKKVTRTIETHVIHGARIKMENGEIKTEDLEPIELFNQGVNAEKALKLIQKVYGKKDQYVVKEIVTTANTYGIDFDFFMEHAEIIEK